MSNPLHIVRYPNRKLYIDGEGYITLTRLADCIRQGLSFRVIKHGEGIDITAIILASIIKKMAARGDISTEALRMMITQAQMIAATDADEKARAVYGETDA